MCSSDLEQCEVIQKSDIFEVMVECKPLYLWHAKEHPLECIQHQPVVLLKTNGSNQILLQDIFDIPP